MRMRRERPLQRTAEIVDAGRRELARYLGRKRRLDQCQTGGSVRDDVRVRHADREVDGAVQPHERRVLDERPRPHQRLR